MKNWFNRNYKTIIISAFLIPIITVAIVSISHVTKWYGISNPVTWAVYLSIGVEIAALSALAAISANMGKKVYFPFGLVTLVQFIGNIYFAYSYIDVNSPSFTSWVELVSPLIEFIGVEPTDLIGHKRFLAFFAGGMLPLISLSFLHMLVKFTQENKEISPNQPINENIVQSNDDVVEEPIKKEEVPTIDAKDIVGEVSRIRLSEEDLLKLEKLLNKTPNPTPTIEEELNVSTHDIPEEYNEIISENFWDLTDSVGIKVEPTPTFSPLTEEVLNSIKEQYEERADYGVEFNENTIPTQEPTMVDDNQPNEYDSSINEEIFTPTPEIDVTQTPEETPPTELVIEILPKIEPTLTIEETPEVTPTPIVEEVIEETPQIETPTFENTETPLPTDEPEEEKKK